MSETNGVREQHAGVLIVGAGQAAVQLVDALRSEGYDRPLVIVGDEPHLPYQRPPLSKAFLAGDVTIDTLLYRESDFFLERGVDVIVGDTVEHIERTDDGARARTRAGRVITCDRLVLATGATPRRLPIPGADAAGVVTLRSAADADEIKRHLERAANIVVIGGGFIGLEVAASATALDKQVTVLEAAPQLMGRAVGGPTSQHYLETIREHGTSVLLDARITAISTDQFGAATGVKLADGSVVPAELVVMGVGVSPRTELAEQLGLAVDNGIVVDESSLASDGWTLAIGDCANLPNPYPVDPQLARIRLESVNNAVEQANFAAHTILGNKVPYRSVPWFWSDQGNVKLQIAGLCSGYDEVVVRRGSRPGAMTFLYLREGRLIAADCVNSPVDFAAVRKALQGEVRVDPEQLADASVKLAALFQGVNT